MYKNLKLSVKGNMTFWSIWNKYVWETGTLLGPNCWLIASSFPCFRAVVRELVETEEEFGRDLQQVVERYLKPLDSSTVPRVVRDNKDLIFSNFKQIADFHNTWVWGLSSIHWYAWTCGRVTPSVSFSHISFHIFSVQLMVVIFILF